jgi:hypothetical protein
MSTYDLKNELANLGSFLQNPMTAQGRGNNAPEVYYDQLNESVLSMVIEQPRDNYIIQVPENETKL